MHSHRTCSWASQQPLHASCRDSYMMLVVRAGNCWVVIHLTCCIDCRIHTKPFNAKWLKRNGSDKADAPARMPEDCLNYHDGCQGWADAGECDKNPSYMKVVQICSQNFACLAYKDAWAQDGLQIIFLQRTVIQTSTHDQTLLHWELE